MSKEYTLLGKLKKFQKDPAKTYTRKFRIYPCFAYPKLDAWLRAMSLEGWHLVDSNMISFLFEQGEPKDKIYFTYTQMPKAGGAYSIGLLYPGLEKTYGVKKKYSKLNKNQAKAYTTIEIDTKKIDIENHIGYRELVSDRNRLYKKLAIRNALVLLVWLLVFIVAMVLDRVA